MKFIGESHHISSDTGTLIHCYICAQKLDNRVKFRIMVPRMLERFGSTKRESMEYTDTNKPVVATPVNTNENALVFHVCASMDRIIGLNCCLLNVTTTCKHLKVCELIAYKMAGLKPFVDVQCKARCVLTQCILFLFFILHVAGGIILYPGTSHWSLYDSSWFGFSCPILYWWRSECWRSYMAFYYPVLLYGLSER